MSIETKALEFMKENFPDMNLTECESVDIPGRKAVFKRADGGNTTFFIPKDSPLRKIWFEYLFGQPSELRDTIPESFDEAEIKSISASKVKHTQRGFERIDFIDDYGKESSLQQSSLWGMEHIWLGQEVGRMHLSKDQVKGLVSVLENWLETGSFKGQIEQA